MSGRGRGFTLWEMVVTLVVLAIVTALALPAFTRLGARDTAAPADVVLGLLRDARRTAIERGVTVWVILDPASGRFRVDTAGPEGAGPLAEGTVALDGGATIAADSARVRFIFRPDGAAFADSLIVRSGGTMVAVLVDPWSGVPRADAR